MSTVLNIDKIQFGWPGSPAPLLDIDSLSIKKGEKIFVQGPSGSGKSTLLNLIGGVLAPQSGKIEILNTEITSLNSEKRDQFRGDHMGFIFQMFNLLPYFTAIENIVIPCEFSKKKLQRALKNSTSLEEEAKRLLSELKLNFKILKNKKVTELSVGQQQRIAAARALIGRPEIVVADEPTSALDTNIRNSFIKLLFEECQKNETTLIFVSHDENLGNLFDRKVSLLEINQAKVSDQLEEEIA